MPTMTTTDTTPTHRSPLAVAVGIVHGIGYLAGLNHASEPAVSVCDHAFRAVRSRFAGPEERIDLAFAWQDGYRAGLSDC